MSNPAGEDPYELADIQRDVAGLLVEFVHAPLLEDQYVRAVMPAPSRAPAVRVALGDRGESRPARLTAYEIPLGSDTDLLTPPDVVALLRAVHTGTHIYPANAVTTVLGMDLYKVNPANEKAAPFTTDDWSATLLRCLAHPEPERRPDTGLRGFRFKEDGLLRLYVDGDGLDGVTAADVRPGGALTAVLAAFPSLLEETYRTSDPGEDPHCLRVVDLADW